ncbi:hypothetical protein [Leptospira sarikeiensis]|uniref:Uncharacterized protein n=1 Tax=Leptospira sarikeiensis TaxID=2484943 RepID=A0A4V3JRP8_9LEPT|nr:hypothetical protein [Leptospira sarikeiensis]TGL61185.1 hypothetical protein EHQ64_11100 [Leptospira sarikeiensis]
MMFEIKKLSPDSWENQIITYLFNNLAERGELSEVAEIFKIDESGELTPDFYSTGYNGLFEVKKVTENEEDMAKVSSSFKALDALSEDLNQRNPLAGSNTTAHIQILDDLILKSRGKEYVQLCNAIIESLEKRELFGKTDHNFFRIEYIELEEYLSSLWFRHGGTVRFINPFNLKIPLKKAISKANEQLKYKQFSESTKYKRILLLGHYYTFTNDPDDIKRSVELLKTEQPEIFNNIDRIYILSRDYFEFIDIQ